MELICPQVDERSPAGRAGGWLREHPGPRREHKIIKWESAPAEPAANQKPSPKEGSQGEEGEGATKCWHSIKSSKIFIEMKMQKMNKCQWNLFLRELSESLLLYTNTRGMVFWYIVV